MAAAPCWPALTISYPSYHPLTLMPFSTVSKKSGKTYILHSRVTVLKGGREQRIFFFAGEAKEGAIDALPDGYMVSENERTGLPILKKKVS